MNSSALRNDYFYAVHATAMVVNPASIICSASILIYLQVVNRHLPFWERRLYDRLVAYLALADLVYSTQRTVDHAYVLATGHFLPGFACQFMGFLLVELVAAQSLFINFIAFSAFWLIVREKRLSYGKHDWILFLSIFGPTIACGVVALVLGYFGPSRAWCLADETKSSGTPFNTVLSSLLLISFTLTFIYYTAVWIKAAQTARHLKQFSETSGDTADSQNARLAKVLSVLVLAYFIQWSPFVVYTLWLFAEPPHPVVLILVVISCNLGGLYNMLAYTVIRRKQNSTRKLPREQDKKFTVVQPPCSLPNETGAQLSTDESLSEVSSQATITTIA